MGVVRLELRDRDNLSELCNKGRGRLTLYGRKAPLVEGYRAGPCGEQSSPRWLVFRFVRLFHLADFRTVIRATLVCF